MLPVSCNENLKLSCSSAGVVRCGGHVNIQLLYLTGSVHLRTPKQMLNHWDHGAIPKLLAYIQYTTHKRSGIFQTM